MKDPAGLSWAACPFWLSIRDVSERFERENPRPMGWDAAQLTLDTLIETMVRERAHEELEKARARRASQARYEDKALF